MDEHIPNTPETPADSALPPYLTPTSAAFPTGKRELLFCAAILICGLALGNFILYGGFNLGFAIAACGSILVSGGYLISSGAKGDWYSRSILILCLVIAAAFGRSDDGFVKFVMVHFLLVGINLGLCLMAGRNRYSPGGVRSLFDAPRTLFALGFGKMGSAFRGLIRVFREGSPFSRASGAVLLGLVIAIPALAVVIPLLMNADAAFEGLLELLPDFDAQELIMTVLYGGAAACILYTRGVALRHFEQPAPAAKTRKRLNVLTMNTALGAVSLVYLVYLFSQLAYFVGGFRGILPQGYSAAEYARRGFFEMAWLCGINLGIITFAISLVAKKPSAPLSTRILCLFLGLVTEFLVASATAKMLLYIDTYGLTRLRLLTMVILAFLGITTALVSVWLFLPKLSYMKAVLLTALILGTGVIWLDVDTQVAKYNVEHYLSGDLDSVDIGHLRGLGDGAVEYLAMLADGRLNPDVTSRTLALEELKHRCIHEAEDFRGWNYVNHQALAILSETQSDRP